MESIEKQFNKILSKVPIFKMTIEDIIEGITGKTQTFDIFEVELHEEMLEKIGKEIKKGFKDLKNLKI